MGQYLTTNNIPTENNNINNINNIPTENNNNNNNENNDNVSRSNDSEKHRLRELDERCDIIKREMDREYTGMLRNRVSKYNRKS